jgi:hypothetical protein
MTGHYLASQIQTWIVGPLIAFREYIFQNVLPAFGNLSERADEMAAEHYRRIGSLPAGDDCEIDMADVAGEAGDRALDWYIMMTSLRQTMRNLRRRVCSI